MEHWFRDTSVVAAVYLAGTLTTRSQRGLRPTVKTTDGAPGCVGTFTVCDSPGFASLRSVTVTDVVVGADREMEARGVEGDADGVGGFVASFTLVKVTGGGGSKSDESLASIPGGRCRDASNSALSEGGCSTTRLKGVVFMAASSAAGRVGGGTSKLTPAPGGEGGRPLLSSEGR